jgi:hypothetical protein
MAKTEMNTEVHGKTNTSRKKDTVQNKKTKESAAKREKVRINLYEVFPDYAVKQAFQIAGMERGDDIIVNMVQNHLLTLCVTELLRAAFVPSMLSGRKFIHASDIQYALDVSTIPVWNRAPLSVCDSILNEAYFGDFCNEHIRLLTRHHASMRNHSRREDDDTFKPPPEKMSQETMKHMQCATERLICGFLDYFAQSVRGQEEKCDASHRKGEKDAGLYTYRAFDRFLDKFMYRDSL